MKGFVQKSCKMCAICGKSFVAKVHNQKYCSQVCRLVAEGKSSGLEEWRKGRNCEICGKFFLPKSSRQKCCSSACMEANSKRLQARFWQRKKDPDSASAAEYDGSYGPDLAQYTRACHDCGKPTNDYRCASCWRKWLEKNKDYCV